jgi:hypothetical protein
MSTVRIAVVVVLFGFDDCLVICVYSCVGSIVASGRSRCFVGPGRRCSAGGNAFRTFNVFPLMCVVVVVAWFM